MATVNHSGDFPPFYAINRTLHSKTGSLPLDDAMKRLKERFPAWMWYNAVTKEFLEYVFARNLGVPTIDRVSVLGMDIYSLFRSAHEVLIYLEDHDPVLSALAEQLYSTLGTFEPDAHAYAEAISKGLVESQQDPVTRILSEIQKRDFELAQAKDDGDEFYSAAENARIVKAAEEYYRKTFMGGAVTWSVRDMAMKDAIQHALDWQTVKNNKETSKIIVWAHNSHVGDSSFTQHSIENQVNLGQLCRQHFGIDETFILGFSTDTGTVRAAKKWNGKDFVLDVLPSMFASSGKLLSEVGNTGVRDFGLMFRSNVRGLTQQETVSKRIMDEARIQRYIGVLYCQSTERQSHYSLGSMGSQYDFMIHIDETRALQRIQVEGHVVREGIDYSKWEYLEVAEDEIEEY